MYASHAALAESHGSGGGQAQGYGYGQASHQSHQYAAAPPPPPLAHQPGYEAQLRQEQYEQGVEGQVQGYREYEGQAVQGYASGQQQRERWVGEGA